jgi:hypothetical protein
MDDRYRNRPKRTLWPSVSPISVQCMALNSKIFRLEKRLWFPTGSPSSPSMSQDRPWLNPGYSELASRNSHTLPKKSSRKSQVLHNLGALGPLRSPVFYSFIDSAMCTCSALLEIPASGRINDTVHEWKQHLDLVSLSFSPTTNIKSSSTILTASKRSWNLCKPFRNFSLQLTPP